MSPAKLREKGLTPEEFRTVIEFMRGFIGEDAVSIEVSANRNLRRAIYSCMYVGPGTLITLPPHSMERSKAFAIYCMVHAFLHCGREEECSHLAGWRSAIHSDEFHKEESWALEFFGIKVVYRDLNWQCELQDSTGTHICDGLGK